MTCPICAKGPVQNYRPFCSKRCADVDLGRWLTESYVVAPDADEDEVPIGTDEEPTMQ
ncbi:MAG: endogenous inhibitor of DNA gyrase (YacG/DUF329 family) [Paracoccaceae bacterium]|jgi:endogenous inhibitor of DNA gyrase (YacG/DUF329 family)